MHVIPAIDIIDGQCVRLTQGDYSRKTVYDSDPVAMAQQFAEEGAKWIHIVDLDGAKAGTPINLHVVKEIVRKVDIQVEFGGGLRDSLAIERALSAGVARVVIGTRLTQDCVEAARWFEKYGDKIIAGIDMKDGLVAVHGWEETSTQRGLDLAKRLESLGCERFNVTDISTDGTLAGPNLELMRTWASELSRPVVASGGVACVEDILSLSSTGCEAVIVGKAIYEGKLTVADAIKNLESVLAKS